MTYKYYVSSLNRKSKGLFSIRVEEMKCNTISLLYMHEAQGTTCDTFLINEKEISLLDHAQCVWHYARNVSWQSIHENTYMKDTHEAKKLVCNALARVDNFPYKFQTSAIYKGFKFWSSEGMFSDSSDQRW